MEIKESHRTRINSEITAPQVRLISESGEQLGVVALSAALEQARSAGLDLVEVAPQAKPPVCKLLDYRKHLFELKKKVKENKKKSRNVVLKEINFRPRIDEHDMEHKIKALRKFLAAGHKVKVNIRFRGREVKYADLGIQLINKVTDMVADLGARDREPKLEGYNMAVYFNAIQPKT